MAGGVVFTLVLGEVIAHLAWVGAASVVARAPAPAFDPKERMTFEDRLPGFAIGAHRGGFWSLSQSTRADFSASLAGGADILEIDLRWTRDDGVVVYHDDTLTNHTFCRGEIRDRTFADVTHCRVLPTGARIESFESVLRWTRGKNVVLDAEFKDDEVIAPALRLVERYDAWDRVYFQANAHYDRYATARMLAPRANLLVGVNDMDTLRWALGLDDPRLVVIHLHEAVQTPEAVALVHQYGKLASANSWRPSDYQEFFSAGCERLFELGVDIIVTNNVQSCAAQRNATSATPRHSRTSLAHAPTSCAAGASTLTPVSASRPRASARALR
jgi:glycerophosphoryl diester phosphodiesterase